MRKLTAHLSVLTYIFSTVALAAQPPVMKDGIDVRAPIVQKQEASTPSNPSSGFRKLYPKADGFYQLDSSGVETKVGTGSGGDYSNFLKNPSFEELSSASKDWTLGSGVTATADIYDFLDGARSTSLSFTSVNGSLIRQCYSAGVDYTGNNLGFEIAVKTSASNVQVCSMQGLTPADAQCADVAANSVWHPTTLNLPGANDQFCIEVKTKASTTGSVKVDRGYVGLARNTTQEDIPPTITVLTSGSGTYYTPVGVSYLEIEMAGGGAGGGGSGTTGGGGGAGSAGGNTMFGTSLLTANGGSAGSWNAGPPDGGSFTVSAPAIDYGSIAGSSGGVGFYVPSGTDVSPHGGGGGVSCLGGAGSSGYNGGSASAAQTNSGSGGGGGGAGNTASMITGNGGGAGACVKAALKNPVASYPYSVGAGGSGGTAGTSGYAGGAGGSGIIIIKEHYNSQARVGAPNTLSIFGALMLYPTATCPDGTVLADGGTTPDVLKSIYGNNLPDARGLALSFAGTRGTAIGGITYSRTLLTAQGDQMQGHYHGLSNGATEMAGNSSGGIPTGGGTWGATSIASPITDGTNGTPRVGSETRMANIAFTPCISMATVAAPLVVGGVMSGSTGTERFERATLTCSSSSSISSQSTPGLFSVGNISSGSCLISYPSNTWSSTPTCVASFSGFGAAQAASLGLSTANTTNIASYCWNGAACTTFNMNIICQGPR